MSPVPANNREPNKQDEVNTADESPQFVIEGSDSDSEGDEGDGYNGYQLLPQDPDSVNPAPETDDGLQSAAQMPSMDAAIMQALDSQDMMNAAAPQSEESHDVPSETVELWNRGPKNPAAHEPMDPDHAEKIKSAMAGFMLPPSAQPAWANHLSDEEWKQVLITKSSLSSSSPCPSSSRTAQTLKTDDKPKDKLLER